MSSEVLYFFTAAIAVSTAGFVFFAILWLRRLRDTVSAALSEAAKQQIHSMKRMGESIARLEKQQENYTLQINALAQAGLRLQQELSNVSALLGDARPDAVRGNQTIH